MDADLLIADYAQAAGGKLNLIGAGWQWCRPFLPNLGVGIIVETPYDQTNQAVDFVLELLTEDGHPYKLMDGTELRVELPHRVGRPSDLPPGAPQRHTYAVNATNLQFEAGKRYEWRLSGGEIVERLSFEVRDG